jgi:surfeit locus 1 family protein
VPGALTRIVLTILLSLGNWQVRRLAWKEDLIARTIARATSAPLDLRQTGLPGSGGAADFLADNEYRPILLAGEFKPAGEVRVFTSIEEPRSGRYSGPGFWIVTPFAAAPDGGMIYVNRGFVPQEKDPPYAPPPEGRVEIEGLLRASEVGNWLTPSPDLGKRVFYARDPARIAAATGLAAGAEPFTLDLTAAETPPSGLPQAGETRIIFPNNHLQYVITWYGLAAALLAVFSAFALGRMRADKKPA